VASAGFGWLKSASAESHQVMKAISLSSSIIGGSINRPLGNVGIIGVSSAWPHQPGLNGGGAAKLQKCQPAHVS